MGRGRQSGGGGREDVSGKDEEGELFKVGGMKGRRLSEKRRKMEYV